MNFYLLWNYEVMRQCNGNEMEMMRWATWSGPGNDGSPESGHGRFTHRNRGRDQTQVVSYYKLSNYKLGRSGELCNNEVCKCNHKQTNQPILIPSIIFQATTFREHHRSRILEVGKMAFHFRAMLRDSWLKLFSNN